MKRFLKEHWIALLLAVLTSVIVAAPQVYFRIEHRNDGVYQGIELLPDSPRSALTREIMDGHPNLGNVYYKDGKDDPYLWQPFQPMAVAYMGELFGLDINNTFLLSRIVLPFLAFMLIYGFALLVSRDKLVALSSAALLLLADLLLSFAGLSGLLQGASPSTFIQIARPVNPVMTYIPLFAFLIAFWLWYTRQTKGWWFASTVLLGATFYTYFYAWSYLYAFGGILVAILLIGREWRQALGLASVYLGGLVLAIPYGINLYRASLFPNYVEVSERFGVVATHAPLFVGVLSVAALLIFLIGFPRNDRRVFFFGLALLVTPLLTMNQQIITGKIMQPDHYHWFFHKPIGIIFILTTVFYLLSRWRLDFYKKALAVGIVAASVLTGALAQASAYRNDPRDGGAIAIERQQYGPVMKWLSAHAEKEAVVFANNEISHLTVIYTPQNVFYHRVVGNSLAATKERLLEVVSTFYRLRGVGASDARRIFFDERGYLSTNIYGIYYREALGSYEAIPDDKIAEALSFYTATLSVPTDEWLQSIFKKYEVEYLVWDKEADPTWNLDRYAFLEKAAEFGTVAIYRFNP
ncbi:MAG: hypothetical protein PHV99_01720 [Candidatus Pacebacteria bacterium]|nr:hypothetical protein [Candidatus Paceibacterota bacterium]